MRISEFGLRAFCVSALALSAVFCGVASVWSTQPVVSKEDKAAAVARMTDGVVAIVKSGLPGPVATLGDSAFPVVVAEYEKGVMQPLVSAAFTGEGRVVALGHDGYCNADRIAASPSTRRLIANVLRWAAGADDDKKNKDVRVAVWRNPGTAKLLKEEGFNAVSVDKVPEAFDVFFGPAAPLNDEQYEQIFNVVKNGGGFVGGALGWGWIQLNPGKNIVSDHSGNRNFAKFGVEIAWTDGDVNPLGGANEYDAKAAIPEYACGGAVVRFVDKIAGSQDEAEKEIAALDANVLRQISSTASLIYPFLATESRDVFKRLASGGDEIVPTEKAPVKSDNLLARLKIAIQTEQYITGQVAGTTDADDVPALAAAQDFPGPVPSEAERCQGVKVAVKTGVPDWNTTGLYAAPGEKIVVRVDKAIFKKLPRQLKIRVGAHRDRNWHLNSWSRYPEICVEKTLDKPEMEIANPFGGPVYVVVPRGIEGAGLGTIEVEISGAVQAPWFVRGETSLEDWKKIREYPAPWAELQGTNVVVTLPSSVIRKLDDPQELMMVWDAALDYIAEFSSTPMRRDRPERICCDRQISAGYMHSGYPVMTWMDVQNDLADAKKLKEQGNWGFYHEFGHNHQSGHWTFAGSTEVTVNYFTLYVMEKLNGIAAADSRPGAIGKDARVKRFKRYVEKENRSFDAWKNDPFLALSMSVQMLEAFGWEPFIRSVDEYRKAPQAELPKNDDQKRDQWMVRMSRNAGKNLGPFFETWGVPTSQAARDSIKDLPVWIPEEIKEFAK
ncbi:MAG: M60 family metallopeptidase [Thermoguttaceae bacterium]|nr:M60 family metallopeptidase [Thermoguttaceae bacterium]